MNRAQVVHIVDSYLTSSVRSIAESERLKACCSLRRLALWPGFCLLLGALMINMQPATAATTIDQWKLYAHSRLVDDKQYQCLKAIIHKESRWNVDARNGSHYGLGQMRSKHYRNLDAFRQIDATIKYITIRYGSMCNAWRFHQRVGHY